MEVNDDWVSAKSFQSQESFPESCKYFRRDQINIECQPVVFLIDYFFRQELSVYFSPWSLIHTNISLDWIVVSEKGRQSRELQGRVRTVGNVSN